MNAGEKLKELRTERGATREELARALNISYRAVASYEQGVRVPRDPMKIKIAQYFGVSVEAIFFSN